MYLYLLFNLNIYFFKSICNYTLAGTIIPLIILIAVIVSSNDISFA